MATKRLNVPAEVHGELLAIVRDALGREPEPHEVGPTLARTVTIAKAATKNADKARRAFQDRHPRQYLQEIEAARTQVATRMGRPDLLDTVWTKNPVPDAPILLERPTDDGFVPLTRERMLDDPDAVQARAVILPNGVVTEEQDGRDVIGTMTGVVGTPFNSVPWVEQNQKLQPFQGRGLAYNLGAFNDAYRADDVLREGIGSIVGIQAGSIIEFRCPPALTPAAAKMLGVDRDRVSLVADELNLALKLGRRIDFSGMFEQTLRTACVSGFGMAEFSMDPRAKTILERITGLEPRLPNTVMRWIQDSPSGRLVGIQQTNPNGNVQRYSPFLDARKVVLLSLDQDGDNFEGLSLIRSARAWDVLGMEFTSSAILHRQRFGLGVPIVRRINGVPNSSSASNTTFAALAQYANLADAVLEVGDGVEVDLLQMEAEKGLVEVLTFCTERKRTAVRNTIAGLGTNGVGAYNLGDIQSQLWLKGLAAFARQVERAWNRIAQVYCSLYHPDLEVLPVMSISGFATRSPAETLTVQRQFLDIKALGILTPNEERDLADRAEVVWSGRGEQADPGDVAEVQPDGTPTEAAVVDGETVVETPAPVLPETPAQPEGSKAPGGAQSQSALGRRMRAESAEQWQPTNDDKRLANLVRTGAPLSLGDLRLLEAYFSQFEGLDVTALPWWKANTPEKQQFLALGGEPMAEWLKVELVDTDATEAFVDEGEEAQTREGVAVLRAPEKYAHIDFTPPKGVQEAAKRALEVRAEKPPSQRGMTPVGIARARDLSNGGNVSPETVRRMLAYFERHESDKQGSTWDEQGPGWQAWHGWGGDAGWAWARKVVGQMDAADEGPVSRSIEGFGRSAADCGCGAAECAQTRAKPMRMEVETRTGTFATWRELTPVESNVAFDRIAEEKAAAVESMTRAVEAEQRAHRAEFVKQSQGRSVAQLANLSVDWTQRYYRAMLPALRSLSDFSRNDALDEMASQLGVRQWTATAQQAKGAASQVEAAATLAARAVNDRTNERLRGAAVQVVNGAPPRTLTAAPLSIGNTAGGLLEQTASTTVNETRAVTAAEEGPEIEWAVYSAVMDRMTCAECARADGKRVRYGTEEYRRLSPPNPRCASVKNSQGSQNLCQCVWIYEFKQTGPERPGPINASGQGLVIREAQQPTADTAGPVSLVLVCGPPGAGKSTWAAQQPASAVIDRDEYVLTDEGAYDPAGRAESFEALLTAIEEADSAGKPVYYVACMLAEHTRAKFLQRVQDATTRPLDISVVAVVAPADQLRAVNEARREQERGMIPPEQFEHLLDAWEMPVNATVVDTSKAVTDGGQTEGQTDANDDSPGDGGDPDGVQRVE